MKYAIFNVPREDNWMNRLPITQNELELLSAFEHSVEAAKADMAERLRAGVSIEPGPFAVDLAAIQFRPSAVVLAAKPSDLKMPIESEGQAEEQDEVGVFERYGPIRRLLSEEDTDLLRSQGLSEQRVRAFRTERRKLYWTYVRSFEQELAAALELRKACMASRGEWDFPALLRQMREVAEIRFRLRSAAVLHLLHVPVDVGCLIEAPLRTAQSFMTIAPAAAN